ncbi:MAG: Rpn family recombination-promoting nuclease/putative transposase [Chloroflexales bacterium]|nr:Rpn family recombination-promoting nuclease/putative transposase [Chloroflexales bacterium]
MRSRFVLYFGHMIDHDAVFKQLLTAFFVEFLDLFAPEVLAMLDPARLTFLDKETFGDPPIRERREADLVVRAQVCGETAWILVHLEHQTPADRTIARRMVDAFARLYAAHGIPIDPIARGAYPTPHTPVIAQHQVAFPHRVVRDFQDQAVQLNWLDWRTYVQHSNPRAGPRLRGDGPRLRGDACGLRRRTGCRSRWPVCSA